MSNPEAMTVEPAALTLLAQHAMRDIAHLLRPGHLEQLRKIVERAASELLLGMLEIQFCQR